MRRRLAGWFALLALALGAQSAPAHVVYERATLREWILGSALVLVAELESDALTWQAHDGSDRQEYFRARPLETLRGESPGDVLEFFPHAEGFPRFRRGERCLLFLERSAGRREFASLASRFPWFSVQGAGQEWTLEGPEGDRILEAARRWSGLGSRPGDDPQAGVRALLLYQLGSGVPRLRSDALVELARMRQIPGFLDAGASVAFSVWVDNPEVPLTQRLALLRILEGAPGFESEARLRALASEASDGPELAQMIRVAGASTDPKLEAWLEELTHDPRPWVRLEAARALALR